MRRWILLVALSSVLLFGVARYRHQQIEKGMALGHTKEVALRTLATALQNQDVETLRTICTASSFETLQGLTNRKDFKEMALYAEIPLESYNSSWGFWALWSRKYMKGPPRKWFRQPMLSGWSYYPALESNAVTFVLGDTGVGWKLHKLIWRSGE